MLWCGGCASPSAPQEPAKPAARLSVEEAIEQARRDERQRIMQEYWYEHTQAADRGAAATSEVGPPLPYPAGLYDGIHFAPRQAADPSLAEPNR